MFIFSTAIDSFWIIIFFMYSFQFFEKFGKFYDDFNEDEFNFGFYPDETYIFAYDSIPYSTNDQTMVECHQRQQVLFKDYIEESYGKQCLI